MTGSGGASGPGPANAARRRGLLALATTGVLWGTVGLVVRLLQDRDNPTAAIAFWRFVCATLVLLPLVGATAVRQLVRGGLRSRRLLVVAAGSLAFQLLFFLAVADLGVALATLIALGLAPVAATVAETARARRRPPALTVAVLTLALAGLALVTFGGVPDAHVAPRPLLGIGEAVLSALAYAVSTSTSSRLSTRVSPFAITLVSSALGVALLLPVVAATGWHVPTAPIDLGGTLWLGIVTTVIAYGFFYAGLRSIPGSVALVVTLLEPLTAVVLAAWLLAESLTIANAVGGLLLLGAVATLCIAPADPRPPETPIPI